MEINRRPLFLVFQVGSYEETKSYKKRKVVISDDFDRCITVKLWGDHANNDDIVEGSRLELYKLVVDEWKTYKSLNTTDQTRIVITEGGPSDDDSQQDGENVVDIVATSEK